MIKNTLISILIIFSSSFFNLNVVSQNSPEYLCSKCKIKASQIRARFSDEKYKKAKSFMYDLKYHRLELSIDPALKYIEGVITTYFTTNTDNFTEISFDMSSFLTTDSVIYNNEKLLFSHTNNEITTTLLNSLSENVLDSITIYYHGIPDQNGFGSFAFNSHNGIPVAWSLSEPYGARDWWPCKQSLNDKIDSIDVFISHPDIYKAASNGLLISETLNSGTTTTHWKHRHLIPAYLIAIAVTNYSVYSDYVTLTTGESVLVQNYVYPESLNSAKIQTTQIAEMMKLFSNLFIPYPYKNEKYGHAQMGWRGGMEHQTMSFMGEFNYHLMAHELAHQWFGDYVTCGSWSDIWINEGFATYLDGMTIEHGIDDGSRYTNFNNWKETLIKNITSRSYGSVHVEDTTNVSNIFSSRLSYHKGAMVLHMLRKKVGDENFFQAVRNYLTDTKLANGYAVTADIQWHIENVSGISIEEFLNDWYYGQGYPIYTINYIQDIDNNVVVKISQNQSHPSVDYFEMMVPIMFYGANNDTTILFDNISEGLSHFVALDFEITKAEFDPEKDIISGGSIISENSNEHNRNLTSIQPNPAKNKITLTTTREIGAHGVLIYNLHGEFVKKYYPPQNTFYQYEINIDNLNNGVYLMKIDIGGEFITKKFVKFAE